MFGNKLHREYKDVIESIGKGTRREPQHNPPSSVEADGTTLLRPEHRIVWEDFRRFGEILNTMMQHGPVSFEEMPKVQFGFDGPDYGRHYQIWYNQVPCGMLIVSVNYLLHSSEGHGGTGEIDLDYAQLMPEAEVRDMLRSMWFLFAKLEDGAVMRQKADIEVTKIMTRHLWEVQRVTDRVHNLHWRFEGPYEHYSQFL
jgi:hypothetical protein